MSETERERFARCLSLHVVRVQPEPSRRAQLLLLLALVLMLAAFVGSAVFA